MQHSTAIASRLATPADVLAIFREDYRYAVELDPEAEPGYEIDFKLTVADWRGACDLLRWKALGRALNQRFKINVPDADWHATLEPAKERTLRDVCALIASRAQLPTVRPTGALGANCAAAGAFRTLCSLLRAHAVPIDGTRPSSALEPVLRSHLSEIISAVVLLAPGAVPPPTIRDHPINRFFLGLLLLSFGAGLLALVVALIGWLVPPLVAWIPPFAAGVVVGLMGVSYIGFLLTLPLPAESIEWGGLRTFRDLALSMAPHVRS